MFTQTKQSHYKLEEMATALTAFEQAYPTYATTQTLDDLRQQEYGRLDAGKHIYLDYTGGSLYAESQLRQHMKVLSQNVFGNPHSRNPTSTAMTNLVEDTRDFILDYFNASPKEYTVVFTQNASGALKLIGESYPFGKNTHYILTADNHNSVNGIREFANSKGATVTYIPLTDELRLETAVLHQILANKPTDDVGLFAFPAQSNFTGVQHDLSWVPKAQKQGWDVLIDAAAFVPTNALNINQWQPDFVTISFYKMFGYPTGIGCLLAKKTSLKKLKRPWFSGGTVDFVSMQHPRHCLSSDEAGFEDGTIDYLNIPAIKTGLNHLQNIGIHLIHERVVCLTGWLIDQLKTLHHSNGEPVIRFYGPTNIEMRGGTITVNFFDPTGQLLDYRHIEALASQENISLRTGCFCNPGVNETAEGLTLEDMEAGFTYKENLTLPLFRTFLLETNRGKNAGAVRISVGLVTNFADVYRFMHFASRFIDHSVAQFEPLQFNLDENCRVTRLRDSA